MWKKYIVTFFPVIFFSCDFFSCDFFSYLSCDFLSCDFFSVCHLCIVYIISHLLEEMYENQISVLLKFNVDILLQQICTMSI